MRLLLVEDEPLIALMIADWLLELGNEIVGPVPTTSEASRFIAHEEFDAAIVDFHLSDGDARSVLNELRARHIPFLLVTGAIVDDAGDLTGIEVLSKPVEFDRLESALKQLSVSAKLSPTL